MVKNCWDPYAVFFLHKLNEGFPYAVKIKQRTIPVNKRLFVLEDIECAAMQKVLKSHAEEETTMKILDEKKCDSTEEKNAKSTVIVVKEEDKDQQKKI